MANMLFASRCFPLLPFACKPLEADNWRLAALSRLTDSIPITTIKNES
jgi:hypothetical protein